MRAIDPTPSTLVSTIGLLLALVFLPAAAPAQTPAATVEDGSNNVVLQSFTEGQLLAPGTALVGGAIPADGSGTRMMWWPDQAAFRAGKVGGTQWNSGNIGTYSVAFGQNTKASGDNSVAMGSDTDATKTGAVATGLRSKATGIYAVAMGFEVEATASDAVAMGSGTKASATQAVAMGRKTEATAKHAAAFGEHTKAANTNSFAIGECNSAASSGGGNVLFVVGSGSFSGGSCTRDDAFTVDKSGSATAVSHDTFSDRRLKTSVQALGDGILKKLARLRPVRFQFKDTSTHPSGEQIGLIAQDVRKEFPALISKGSQGYLSLAYPKLTAVLLKGIQEQQAHLEAQRARIDSLRNRVAQIDVLRNRVAQLEDRSGGAVLAGLTGTSVSLLIAFLLGGLLGAGLLATCRP